MQDYAILLERFATEVGCRNDDMEVEMDDVKPGYRSSEFWITAVTVLVGLLLASGAFPDDGSMARALAFVASALASMGYSWSRARVKAD